MTTVHARAEVSQQARLAEDVTVGPFVVIEGDVTVGPGTTLLPGTVLFDGARIGARCRLGPYASVAGRPEDRAFAGERSFAVLEDEVELRDFATVHRATGAGLETRVGTRSLLMSYAHVSHNGQVGPDTTLTNLVQLGGHCEVGAGAVLGAGVMTHQFTRIGRLAMVGAAAGLNRDVLPFAMARGNPAEHFRTNRLGLERAGVASATCNEIQDAMRCLRRRDRAGFDARAVRSDVVAEMGAFIAASRRGIAAFRGRR